MSIDELVFRFGGALQTRVPLAKKKLQSIREHSAQRPGGQSSDLSDPVYAVVAYFLASKEEGQADTADLKHRLLQEHNVSKEHFRDVCRLIEQQQQQQQRPRPQQQPKQAQKQQKQQQQPPPPPPPQQAHHQKQHQRQHQQQSRAVTRPRGGQSDGQDLTGKVSAGLGRAKKQRVARVPRRLITIPRDGGALGGTYASWKHDVQGAACFRQTTAGYVEIATGQSVGKTELAVSS